MATDYWSLPARKLKKFLECLPYSQTPASSSSLTFGYGNLKSTIITEYEYSLIILLFVTNSNLEHLLQSKCIYSLFNVLWVSFGLNRLVWNILWIRRIQESHFTLARSTLKCYTMASCTTASTGGWTRLPNLIPLCTLTLVSSGHFCKRHGTNCCYPRTRNNQSYTSFLISYNNQK